MVGVHELSARSYFVLFYYFSSVFEECPSACLYPPSLLDEWLKNMLKLFALMAKFDLYASQFNVQAIANLSVNANVAKAVAEEGGISVLAILAKSMNRLAAEEAAGGLWNLSVGEEHKVVRFIVTFIVCSAICFFLNKVQLQAAIAEAGGVKALVDLIFKWSITGGEGVLVRALAGHVHMHVIPMPCIFTCNLCQLPHKIGSYQLMFLLLTCLFFPLLRNVLLVH